MIFVFLILFFLIYANFYTINFLTVSPLDSLSICITLINSFMVITDLFIYFINLSTTMIYDINCCDTKIIKFITTISLYVIPFILFNHIIRGKEGKTGFNGVFCYSSDNSI